MTYRIGSPRSGSRPARSNAKERERKRRISVLQAIQVTKVNIIARSALGERKSFRAGRSSGRQRGCLMFAVEREPPHTSAMLGGCSIGTARFVKYLRCDPSERTTKLARTIEAPICRSRQRKSLTFRRYLSRTDRVPRPTSKSDEHNSRARSLSDLFIPSKSFRKCLSINAEKVRAFEVSPQPFARRFPPVVHRCWTLPRCSLRNFQFNPSFRRASEISLQHYRFDERRAPYIVYVNGCDAFVPRARNLMHKPHTDCTSVSLHLPVDVVPVVKPLPVSRPPARRCMYEMSRACIYTYLDDQGSPALATEIANRIDRKSFGIHQVTSLLARQLNEESRCYNIYVKSAVFTEYKYK